jgi:hypothetical protein
MFITLKRTDIPNGTLMIRDLWPNQSQYNPVIDPLPQGPFYLTNPSNGAVTVVVSGESRTLKKASTGLTAYLLATMNGADNGAGGFNSLTQAQAEDIADAILVAMRSGDPLEDTDIETIGQGVVADVALAESTISVPNILAILSGAVFTLPAGHVIQNDVAGAGVFASLSVNNQALYFVGDKNQRLLTSDLAVSSAEGALSVMLTDNFTYLGTGSQAVVIYNNNGTVYDPQA